MAWWLHLTNQAILYLDILDGEPPILAVWTRRTRVAYYDFTNGALLSEQTFDLKSQDDYLSDGWQALVAALKASNGVYLPLLRLDVFTLYLTNDGLMRLYHQHGSDDALILESDGQETPLDTSEAAQLVSVCLDRQLGTIAALDRGGKLHLYQQHIRLGGFDLGLTLRPELRPHVVMADGAQSIFISDGQRIIRTDSSGQVLKKIDTHYYIRQICCSPDGRYVMANDLDNGVIHVYDGETLQATHQRFAIDLLAEATQVQLMAEMPPVSVAPTTITCNNDGKIAFAMSGVICVTALSHLDELPRPQTLF
jgi:hypothetical protein